MNPGAPAELAQFAFMIGEFDCIDENTMGRLEQHKAFNCRIGRIISLKASAGYSEDCRPRWERAATPALAQSHGLTLKT